MRFTIVLGVLEQVLVVALLSLLVLLLAGGCGRKPAPSADSAPPAATPRADGSPSSAAEELLLRESQTAKGQSAERASQGNPTPLGSAGTPGSPGSSGSSGSPAKNSAAAILNEQVDRFNLARAPGKGIRPIYDKVQRAVYDGRSDTIWCFDDRGVFFLTLTRQADRNFAGALHVEYHEPAAPGGSPGKASSGYVIAAFILPASVVPQLETTSP